MIKRRRWSKWDCIKLKKMWDEKRKTHKFDELTEILADEFNCSAGAIAWRIAIIEGRARKGVKRNTAHWTPEEIKIIEKFKKALVNSEITTVQARDLNKLLPDRTYTQLKTKIIRMGITFIRKTKDDSEADRHIEQVKEEKCLIKKDNIYDKAAKLVGGRYIDGMIIVGSFPLTGKQTLDALAMARGL